MIFAGDEMSGLSSDDRKKRPRTAFTAAQIKALESEFEKNKYLSVSKRMQLSKQLKLTETQVLRTRRRIFAVFAYRIFRSKFGSKTAEQNGGGFVFYFYKTLICSSMGFVENVA